MKHIVTSPNMTATEIDFYNLRHDTQLRVSSGAYQAVSEALPLPAQQVEIIARIYGIHATFYRKGESILRAANLDGNRWTCRTEEGQVTSVSLG